MQASPLLQLPINELGLSNGFKQMAALHDFRNLQDIVNWPSDVLLKHHNFTYHFYQELRIFLKRNELLDFLKVDNSKSV